MSYLDEYQPVEDRLREFWTLHPYGRIVTDLIHHDGSDYIVRAVVYRGDEVGSTPPAATGLAHDSADLLPANMKASALEVCETSAIGRALANLGLAPKGARPSLEEMQKARAAVVSPPKPRKPAPSDNAATKAPEDVQAIATVQMLTAALGSPKQAANWVNRHCHTSYDAGTVVEATTEELEIAVAALSERGGA